MIDSRNCDIGGIGDIGDIGDKTKPLGLCR